MKSNGLQSAIRVNHRGFTQNSAKRFILTENKTGDLSFSVLLVRDVKEILAFEGTMCPVSENGNTYYVGDFSSVCECGDYFIKAGGFSSRQFVIYDKAYDICERIMLEYFTYQRCGHALGWNGKCHTDDGYIKETGEHIDLSGGYHQSCDLRKSPGGVSIGVLSMLRFAIRDKSEWGEILALDECRWALEYYIKTIQENGVMYNTLNAPFGWDGRIFYKSGAPSSSQWNVTSILALGYRYFKDRDKDFADRCLEKSLLSYEYMSSEKRSTERYKHPDKYPLGMDPDFFFDLCKKGSSADLALTIVASAELYRATGEDRFLDKIKEALPVLLSYVDGFILMREDAKDRSVYASCSYSWLMGGLLALCDAYELLGNVCSLEEKMRHSLDKICAYADKSVWRNIQIPYFEGDLDAPCGHENKTRRQSMHNLEKYDDFYYSSNQLFEPSFACYIGVYLARCSHLLGERKYMEYAQSIADSLLGTNELDSSRVHAVGFNHAKHVSYGQFFPSTPFIPGAVGVGYNSLDPNEPHGSEFDMPCVGLSMYLLSEITH